MTLIEGIGDEVTHFFLALILLIIVCLAWWTTSISDPHRHVQTVWLLDRRRHRAHRRLTNHTHSVIIAEGTTTAEEPPDDSQPTESVPVAASSEPPEAGPSAEEQEEQTRIVQAMDSDASVLRQRRLAFYNKSTTPNESATGSSDSGETVIMEHNYAEEASNPQPDTATIIRIKLKYINDDLKLVDGKLQEQLGDFKKRHFDRELAENKLVRLIFNGQVLNQDANTLETCGLFDNCVVHCLIHQKRSSSSGEENPTTARSGDSSHGGRNNNNQNPQINNNNNQGRDWDLGNFLLAVITFTLLSAWYFRYVYAHLYTVTATVGLVLLTGVFTIVMFGFYFPDHEHLPQHFENAAT